jgi:hypothetical protein
MALCNIYLVQERVAEAMQILEPALEVIRARGIPIPWATALRGYALALSGRPEEGCTVLAGGWRKPTGCGSSSATRSGWRGWRTRT